MRRLGLGLLFLAPLGACGTRERTPALAPVRVRLTAPADLARVQSHTVAVSGSVTPPDARVLVDGAEADVHGGAFTASVELDGGANMIDVQAAAPRHPAAMTVVRVTRLVPVAVPELRGYPPDDAVAALRARGLSAVVRGSGLLDSLLPGTVGVCATDPAAGEKVKVGTTVTVVTGKVC